MNFSDNTINHYLKALILNFIQQGMERWYNQNMQQRLGIL